MRKALTTAHLYPDGGGFYLRQALAKKLRASEIDNIVLGTGSNEIIEFLYHAFVAPGDEVVAGDRAFVIYSIMAKMFQARCIEVPFKGHTHDLKAMRAAITAKDQAGLRCQPEQSVGHARDERGTRCVHPQSAAARDFAVLDEAYIEFLDDPPPSIEYADWEATFLSRPTSGRDSGQECPSHEAPKVVVLRTFSKIVGLAGLRIGYGIAQKECIALLQKVRQPFNVNAVAQAGALAALDDTAHIRKTKTMTRRGLAYLEKEFKRLNLEFVPSCANFILVNVGDGDRIFRGLQTARRDRASDARLQDARMGPRDGGIAGGEPANSFGHWN